MCGQLCCYNWRLDVFARNNSCLLWGVNMVASPRGDCLSTFMVAAVQRMGGSELVRDDIMPVVYCCACLLYRVVGH